MRTIRITVLAGLGLVLAPAPASAQAGVADFYRGRTIEVQVGSDVGGGYNAYARTVARHIVKYIPGKPDVVVKNMPGAGGRKLTGWLANVAPKDGSVIAASQPGSLVEPVLGDPKNARYDPRTFGYIGSPESSVYLCIARADAPAKTFAEALKTEIIMGGSGRGASTLDTTLMLKNLVGAKFKVVKGYAGTREIILALEKGEVHGLCGYAWSSLMSQAGHLVRDKKVNLLVQYALEPSREVTKLGVPEIWQFVKDKETREVLELTVAQQTFGRPNFVPAGVPPARLAALRAAFDETMKDKEFLAEAAKQKLDISPASGKRIEELIARIFTAPKAVQEKAKAALYTD